jgi:hypothetical protein
MSPKNPKYAVLSKLLFVLVASLLTTIAPSNATRSRQMYTGTWLQCGKDPRSAGCSYNVLNQKAGRICGVWSYWASGRQYDGRLVATVRGATAKIEKICGRPGSDTSTNCTRKGNTPTWEPSDRTLFVCDGALYNVKVGQMSSCRNANKALGMPKARGNAHPEVRLFAEDKAWLAACPDSI